MRFCRHAAGFPACGRCRRISRFDLEATARSTTAKFASRTALVLSKQLLTNRRVGRLPKLLVAIPLAYFVSPIQLIPNFIPVLGQLDDVVLFVVCLRLAKLCVSPQLLAEFTRSGPAIGDRASEKRKAGQQTLGQRRNHVQAA
jgi:uncharacterized membrane protein YkvA (DUF1232 family)